MTVKYTRVIHSLKNVYFKYFFIGIYFRIYRTPGPDYKKKCIVVFSYIFSTYSLYLFQALNLRPILNFSFSKFNAASIFILDNITHVQKNTIKYTFTEKANCLPALQHERSCKEEGKNTENAHEWNDVFVEYNENQRKKCITF